MNSHGDIELIMDDFNLPCEETNKHTQDKQDQQMTTGTEIPDPEAITDKKCVPPDLQTQTQSEVLSSSLTSQKIPATGEQGICPEKDKVSWLFRRVPLC